MADWLSPTYEVITTDGEPSDEEFDLCIVDGPMLATHRERLQTAKKQAAPIFLPYVLMSTTTNPKPTSQVWDDVDEVISVPTQKATLHHRLTNLLERRALSQQLAGDFQEQRELFRKIFESSNDAILVTDLDKDTIRECNPQACELLGYTRTELCSLTPAEIHSGELPTYRAFVESVVEEGHGWIDELSCQTKTGERLDAEISASRLELNGRPHLLASVRDVTTRNEQHRILNSLHDTTVELMGASTKQEIAEVTVKAAKRVFNYDIVGVRLLNEKTSPQTLELAAATTDIEDLLEPDPPAYEVGEGPVGQSFEHEEREVIDDLRERDTPFEYDPIRSAMCFPLESYGVLSIGATDSASFTDDDVQMAAILATNAAAALTRSDREVALRDRTASLIGLFENTIDGIVEAEFIDGMPYIRDVNPAFERIFGYDRDTIQGESLAKLVVPTEQEPESQILINHALAGRYIETEARRKTATGRRDFLIRVIPVDPDGSGVGAYLAYMDITERKRRDQQLQVLNRVLRHNIRNKLNVARGVVEQTIKKDGEVSDSLAHDGLDAINQLLDLSEKARELTTESNSQNDPESVAVADLVTRTIESLEQEYPDAVISTDVTTETSVADTGRLNQVLQELCENAIEHTDQPEPSVRIRVMSDPDSDEQINIAVEDDGPGIPDDQRAVLQDGEETPLQHGDGLGLWTVHWSVRMAGGDLDLGEASDRGTTVTVIWPTVSQDTARLEWGRITGDTNE
ncbi:PAS domain S-box protein [Halorubrum sp. DTA98]|uniref:PAS domain S-box protein n=1 Tax=Halorubrum sp. DTA98 TaxID=3402163 RepID=UPI003AAE9C6E